MFAAWKSPRQLKKVGIMEVVTQGHRELFAPQMKFTLVERDVSGTQDLNCITSKTRNITLWT